MDGKQIAFGGALKATQLDENTVRVGGYLIYFTDSTEKDLHEEYFNAKTDLCVKSYDEMNGLPVYYQHGLDPTLEIKQIGTLENVHADEVGVWADAQMELYDEYQRAVFKLTQKGALAWSSGAWPQSCKTAPDGWIERWKVIEGSFTPTPAMPLRTVISAKAYTEMLKDGTGHEEHDVETRGDTKAVTTDDTTLPMRMTMKEKILQMLAAIAEMLNGEAIMDDEERVDVMRAMEDEAKSLPEEEVKALETDEDTPVKTAVIDKLILKASKARADRKIKQQNALKARFDHLKQNAPAPSVTDAYGLPTQSRVTGMQDLKYDGLTASDMLLGLQVSMAASKSSGFTNVDPRMVGISEGYLRAMYAKAQANTENPHHAAEYSTALKTAFPRGLKANELDASNIVSQGFEWVSQYWGTTVWETPRAPTMYDDLVRLGLGSQVVPQGAQTIYIPTEGSDPIVYSSPEANSVDSTGRPEVTVPITPFGTGRVALTPGELKLATSYTVILGEDSIVPIVRQLNMQIDKKMKQTRDQVLLNGDIATGNSVNINLIDSTPSTGIRRPYYLNSDGFRKLPLVTNTAMSRDGGVFTLGDFAATLALFPYAQRTILRNMVFVLDGNAQMWALDFPQWLTPQVAGGRGFGTLENGVLTAAYGAPIITNGYIPLTGAAGKEYGLPANLALNVKSTLLAVDLSQWMVGYKREMTIETARDILSGSELIVASMRMGIVPRSNTASAISYNLTQV